MRFLSNNTVPDQHSAHVGLARLPWFYTASDCRGPNTASPAAAARFPRISSSRRIRRTDAAQSESVSGRACPAPCWERPKATILAVEHQFKVPLADWLPQLVGRVDLIEVHEEGLIALVDCKTSRGRWGPDDLLQHAGQLALYAAGVEELVRTIGKEVRVGSRR